MNIRDTDAWEAAEWNYSTIHASQMMPIPGMTQSPDEIVERLAEITRECPEFYPAVLELGLRRLAAWPSDPQEERIEQGLHLMLELADPEHIEEEAESLIDNLENLKRFDIARRCLELLVERYPDKALFHDFLGYAASGMGDIETSLRQGAEAVAMEPENSYFRSNLGLFHLMAGNRDEAGAHLTAAFDLDPENEVTKGNLEVLEYVTKHGGNFFDYFFRPADRKEIVRLSDEEDWEPLDRMCATYNRDRLEAFGQTLAFDEDKRRRCADMVANLRSFFDFVHQVSNMTDLLDEDIAHVHEYFNPIMHKFIFKFRDVDGQMIEDICESLLEYFGVLARRNLVSSEEFEQFQQMVRSRKKGLVEKTERYNEIRHDASMTEEEKEAIREELFEGDHVWPHL